MQLEAEIKIGLQSAMPRRVRCKNFFLRQHISNKCIEEMLMRMKVSRMEENK